MPPSSKQHSSASLVLALGCEILSPRHERVFEQILAPRADAHTVTSTPKPRLSLQPGLHTKGGFPLGTHTEQKGAQTTDGPGLNPRPLAQRIPLGRRTEQTGPMHQHSANTAQSIAASTTHWTHAPIKPHGRAAKQLSTLPAFLWANGSCFWTWARGFGAVGSAPFQPASPPPDGAVAIGRPLGTPPAGCSHLPPARDSKQHIHHPS